MTIEELFGTLQQSVVGSWRKHLKTSKHSTHVILDDFYTEMPELVDALIENWMGVNGKVEKYMNILDEKEYSAIEYMEKLKSIVEEGREIINDDEIEAKLDDIDSLINSTIYKLKQLSESTSNKSLKHYIKESLA